MDAKEAKIIDITHVVCRPTDKKGPENQLSEKKGDSSYNVTLLLKFSNGDTNDVTLSVEGDDVTDEYSAFLKAKDIVQNKIEVHLSKASKTDEEI